MSGQGSAANSVVCYCLRITEVSPQKASLLFERFLLSKERNEPPDIDVDFEHERREEVIQYIYKKYGRERAALTATVVYYRPKNAIRDIGKALGLEPTRLLPIHARFCSSSGGAIALSACASVQNIYTDLKFSKNRARVMAEKSKARRGRPSGEGEQGAATRLAILDAAEQRFADEGFAKARLQDIAADAGKTAPAIAHFFKDKTSLFNEVIARLAEDFSRQVMAATASQKTDGVDQVIIWIEAWIRFMRRRPALLGFILRDMAEGRLHPLSPTSWTSKTDPLARLLEEASRKDGMALGEGAVINITGGATVFFCIRAAQLDDARFEKAMKAHLETLRKALHGALGRK